MRLREAAEADGRRVPGILGSTGAPPRHQRHCEGRAGSADEQFLHHPGSLSDHRDRRAVRRALLHRLERLPRRVRGGGHAPARPRGAGRRVGQSAPAADALLPFREGAHCRHLRQPPGAAVPLREPGHQAFDPADLPRRGGGQRDRAAAPGIAGGAQRQGRLELAEPGTGLQRRRLSAGQRVAGVGQDHRRHTGAAWRRRRRAHPLRGDQRRAVVSGARRPLSLPRHLRQGPRGARAARRHRPRRARQHRALQGRPAQRGSGIDLYAGRAPGRSHGQAEHRRRAHGASADRGSLERSATG